MHKLPTLLLTSFLSTGVIAETVDILFIYTPDGKVDFDAGNASESDIMSHVNQSFSDAGTATDFRNVGSYIMEGYDWPYYGDDIKEAFDDTSEMHYDLLTEGSFDWVADAREKRKIFGADIVAFITGDADVEPDAGGQGPGGYFGSGGGYILVPGVYAWDEPIFSHEIKHVYGMSHEEMDSGDTSDLFTNAYAVAHFVEHESNAYLWSSDFVGPVSNAEAMQYLDCETIGSQKSSWSSSDYKNAIAFSNESGISLNLFWIDYSGTEVPVATIAPGEAHGVSTSSQHPWVVRNTEFPFECIGGTINKGQNYEFVNLNSRYSDSIDFWLQPIK